VAAAFRPADDSLECQAWSLLRRYGIVFRRLLTRETAAAPWRELTRVYRRLEARGEIRGGRFVSGMSGEQYALPDAVPVLREVRRTPPNGAFYACPPPIRSTWPASSPRARASRARGRNRIAYRDGVPVAVLENQVVKLLQPLDAEDAVGSWRACSAIAVARASHRSLRWRCDHGIRARQATRRTRTARPAGRARSSGPRARFCRRAGLHRGQRCSISAPGSGMWRGWRASSSARRRRRRARRRLARRSPSRATRAAKRASATCRSSRPTSGRGAPEAFDAVTGRLILFHLPDPVAVVRHHIGNLRADGVFVAVDFDLRRRAYGAGRASGPRAPGLGDPRLQRRRCRPRDRGAAGTDSSAGRLAGRDDLRHAGLPAAR
jgi:hypothetical protein